MNRFPGTWWPIGVAPAVALLAVLATHQAQADGVSIKGIVTDQAGQPVPQEPVKVQGSDQSATTITNSKGEFVLFNLPSGDYEVSAGGAKERVRLERATPWWSFTSGAKPVSVDLKATDSPSTEAPSEPMSSEELQNKIRVLEEQLRQHQSAEEPPIKEQPKSE
jgi:hypothetical protein